MKSQVNVYCWHEHGHVKYSNASDPWEFQSLLQVRLNRMVAASSPDWIGMLTNCRPLAKTSVSRMNQLQLPLPECWQCVQKLPNAACPSVTSTQDCFPTETPYCSYLTRFLLFPAVYNKLSECSGYCWCISLRWQDPPKLSFSICVFVTSFSVTPVGSIPKPCRSQYGSFSLYYCFEL